MYAGGPMTAADWTTANPLLSRFQVGFVKDAATGAITGRKVGNGSQRWTALPWLIDPSGSGGGVVNYAQWPITLADIQAELGGESDGTIILPEIAVGAGESVLFFNANIRITETLNGPGISSSCNFHLNDGGGVNFCNLNSRSAGQDSDNGGSGTPDRGFPASTTDMPLRIAMTLPIPAEDLTAGALIVDAFYAVKSTPS